MLKNEQKTDLERTIDRALRNRLDAIGIRVEGLRDEILDALEQAGWQFYKPRPVPGAKHVVVPSEPTVGDVMRNRDFSTGDVQLARRQAMLGPDNGSGPEYVDVPASSIKQRRRRDRE